MTDTHIRARLGYLEQALAELADGRRNPAARALAEQYVATYYRDFNVISEITFAKTLSKKA